MVKPKSVWYVAGLVGSAVVLAGCGQGQASLGAPQPVAQGTQVSTPPYLAAGAGGETGQDLWVLGSSALAVSRDGGATWADESLPADPAAIATVAILSDETVAVSVNPPGDSVGVEVLPLGQTSWRMSVVPVGVPVGGAQVVNAGGILDGVMITEQTSVQFSEGVWLGTPDGGTTWHANATPVGGTVTDAGGLWLVGGVLHQSIYLSSDGGTSWQLINIPGTMGGPVAFGPVEATSGGILLTATKADSDQVQVVEGLASGSDWQWADGPVAAVGGQFGAGATAASSLAGGVLWIVSPTYRVTLLTVATATLTTLAATGLPTNGTFDLDAISGSSAVATYTSTACPADKLGCTQTSGMLATTDGGQQWSPVAVPLVNGAP